MILRFIASEFVRNIFSFGISQWFFGRNEKTISGIPLKTTFSQEFHLVKFIIFHSDKIYLGFIIFLIKLTFLLTKKIISGIPGILSLNNSCLNKQKRHQISWYDCRKFLLKQIFIETICKKKSLIWFQRTNSVL